MFKGMYFVLDHRNIGEARQAQWSIPHPGFGFNGLYGAWAVLEQDVKDNQTD